MTIDVGRVEMVPVELITVSDRAREEMGDLEGLEDSMKESGLTTPLTFQFKDGDYILLAGERRFTILKRNEVTLIPGRIYDRELTELEIKIIEKAENFYRKDWEYWELDKLTREITQMQQELHGVKAPGPGQDGWGLADTGEMLNGITKAAVSQSIKRAEAREIFPELFENCKTASDASKVLKRVNEAIVKDLIAKKLESEPMSNSFAKTAASFVIGNCFEGLAKCPDGVFQLCELDTPYAVGIKEGKKSDNVSQYNLEDYNEVPKDIFMDGDLQTTWHGLNVLLKECYRVMSTHSWLIVWFGPEPWFEPTFQAIIGAGFESTRMCGIWTKPSGQSKRPEIHLANTYEMFFYAWKGRPALNKAGSSNILNYAPVPAQQKTHPTERPIDLMQDIYNTFAFANSRVVIPCLGSGVGILAANSLGMSAVGWDLAKSNKDSFLVRLNSEKFV